MNQFKLETVDDIVRLIQVCVWGFVVLILMLVLGGIVGTMLYSVTFEQSCVNRQSGRWQRFLLKFAGSWQKYL